VVSLAQFDICVFSLVWLGWLFGLFPSWFVWFNVAEKRTTKKKQEEG